MWCWSSIFWCNIWDRLWRWIQRNLRKQRRVSGNSFPGNVYRYQLLANSVDEANHEVDIYDFINMDIASSDDETLIIDLNILDVMADLPPKNSVDWTSCWVSSRSIYRCSQCESLSEQYSDVTLVQWQQNTFILNIRFLSISVHVVVLYVVIVMYLYLLPGYEKKESVKNDGSWGNFWWKTCGFERVNNTGID